MLPVYGKLVPEEGMWVFKTPLWMKFRLLCCNICFKEHQSFVTVVSV